MIFSLAHPVICILDILDNQSDLSHDFINFFLVFNFLLFIISLSKKIFLQWFLELVESELLLNAITPFLGSISVFFSDSDILISLSLFSYSSRLFFLSFILSKFTSSFFSKSLFLFFSSLFGLDFNLVLENLIQFSLGILLFFNSDWGVGAVDNSLQVLLFEEASQQLSGGFSLCLSNFCLSCLIGFFFESLPLSLSKTLVDSLSGLVCCTFSV